MLGKLIKFELKGTARMMLPMYGGIMILAIVNRLLFMINSDSVGIKLLQGLGAVLYVLMAMALIVLTVVFIIYRFYKNMLTDEGYLMFTLPVKTWQHITAKTIVASIWLLITSVAFMLSMLILMADVNLVTAFGELFGAIGELFTMSFSQFGVGLTLLWGIIWIVIFILNLVCVNLQFYFSISVGQLLNKHKILCAIAVYVIINIIFQIIGALGMFGFMPGLNELVNGATITDQLVMGMATGVSVVFLVFSAIITALFFFGTNYLLSKRLNLQ